MLDFRQGNCIIRWEREKGYQDPVSGEHFRTPAEAVATVIERPGQDREAWLDLCDNILRFFKATSVDEAAEMEEVCFG